MFLTLTWFDIYSVLPIVLKYLKNSCQRWNKAVFTLSPVADGINGEGLVCFSWNILLLYITSKILFSRVGKQRIWTRGHRNYQPWMFSAFPAIYRRTFSFCIENDIVSLSCFTTPMLSIPTEWCGILRLWMQWYRMFNITAICYLINNRGFSSSAIIAWYFVHSSFDDK
jgi:hypothetical protein